MKLIRPIHFLSLVSLVFIFLTAVIDSPPARAQFLNYQECLDAGQTPAECAYLQQGSQSGFSRQPTSGDFSLPPTTKAKSIEDLLRAVAGFLLTIAIPIATIMVIIGAFQILTSGGSPDKVTTGKKTIIYAVVGLAIIALFRVLLAILGQLLGAGIRA